MAKHKFVVRAPALDEQQITIFFQNIDLFLINKNKILTTPQYYRLYIRGCDLLPMYVSGKKLYLGDLLLLWSDFDSLWKYQTGDDTIYIFGVGGSPLTGRNFCKGWSMKEQKVVRFQRESFIRLYMPAAKLQAPPVQQIGSEIVSLDTLIGCLSHDNC